MNDLLNRAWSWEIRALPVLTGLVIAELPMWIRRWTRALYVPVYAPFLLEELNSDLALYYGEDFFGGGVKLDDAGLKRLRKRLLVTAFVSMLLSAVVTPLFYGAVLAFILSESVFTQFLIVMAVYRSTRCYWSYRNFGAHSTTTLASQTLLAFIYIMFVGAVTELASEGYRWAQPFAAAGNWTGLLGQLSRLIFVQGAIVGVVVAAASTLLSNFLADPQLRTDQLEEIRRRYANARPIPAPSAKVQEDR